ncbi:MAG: hypothetical protein HOW73_31210 [Polyangiaceae bacterium]|nr:hypothetical protein [Polyangiaceae bacterium]
MQTLPHTAQRAAGPPSQLRAPGLALLARPSPSRAMGPIVLSGILAAVGCSKPATQGYECRCEYLTDTDVPGIQDVRVCAGESEDPKPIAAECAASLGVGQVERCTCPESSEPCGGAKCEQAAARDTASQ